MGEVTGPLGAPPSTSWEETDCGCAYPRVELGNQEADELDLEIAYCPGEAQSELFAKNCGEQWQWIFQYPPRVGPATGGGFECTTCAQTFGGYISTFDPQTVASDEFMKADMTILRSTEFECFCWTDPA